MIRITSKIPLVIVIIFSFVFLYFFQNEILLWRGLPSKLVIKPGENAVLVAIGGLRGVAADLLYLKADEFWQEGKWEEVFGMYRAITILQPQYADYWSNLGFHLAWNLSFRAESEEEKQRYIEQGIRFLKEGVSYNQDVYQLYFDIAFIYDHKLKDYDEAVRWYRKAVEFSQHPIFIDRLIAHSLRKKGNLQGAYQEWLRLKTINPDDTYHQEIVELNLKIVEEELKKSDKTN